MAQPHVRIRLGSAIAEKAGRAYITLPRHDTMTASQLRSELASLYPDVEPLITMAVIFANGTSLTDNDVLPEGEIVVLNPIAGG